VTNGQKETNRKRIYEGFCQYFFTIVSTYPFIDLVWKIPKSLYPRIYNRFRFGYFSTVEVLSHLRKIKRSKAAGPDNLPPNLLKDSANQLVKWFGENELILNLKKVRLRQ